MSDHKRVLAVTSGGLLITNFGPFENVMKSDPRLGIKMLEPGEKPVPIDAIKSKPPTWAECEAHEPGKPLWPTVL